MSVCWLAFQLVRRSVIFSYKGREVTLPCFYRRTRLLKAYFPCNLPYYLFYRTLERDAHPVRVCWLVCQLGSSVIFPDKGREVTLPCLYRWSRFLKAYFSLQFTLLLPLERNKLIILLSLSRFQNQIDRVGELEGGGVDKRPGNGDQWWVDGVITWPWVLLQWMERMGWFPRGIREGRVQGNIIAMKNYVSYSIT